MFAVIGGSAAYDLLKGSATSSVLSSAERIGPWPTPFGPSQSVFKLRAGSSEFLFLSRHGERGYEVAAPFVNYRANIYALRDLGATRILAWSGPGAIDLQLRPGMFVIPDDLMDETHGRGSTFFEGTGLGFIRQSPVFCPELATVVSRVLDQLGLIHRPKANYVCTQGPRLETPAEVAKYRTLGGHLVGMTLAPEVFLAKELEMCYAAVCYVSNYAEGLRRAQFEPGVLFEGLLATEEEQAVRSAVAQLPTIILRVAVFLATAARACPCGMTMERYRRKGLVGPDWREWARG